MVESLDGLGNANVVCHRLGLDRLGRLVDHREKTVRCQLIFYDRGSSIVLLQGNLLMNRDGQNLLILDCQ